MTILKLTPEERKLMVEMLKGCISEIRMEVGATESYEFKENLKKKEQYLKAVLARLEKATAE